MDPSVAWDGWMDGWMDVTRWYLAADPGQPTALPQAAIDMEYAGLRFSMYVVRDRILQPPVLNEAPALDKQGDLRYSMRTSYTEADGEL